MKSYAATLTFSGGAQSVTGSNFLFEGDFGKVLIDCGLVQGDHYAEDDNRKEFPYDPSSIDILVVTHAHIDHIGRVPKLVRDGFRGIIYSTEATRDLAAPMLEDALSILETEAKREKKEPLYARENVVAALSLWKGLLYRTEQEFRNGVIFRLLDAGHILGSAMVEFSRGEEKILFTGDLGNSPSLLLPDTDEMKGLTYLVTESVYGDRNHESKEVRNSRFFEVLQKTVLRGGTVLLPAFSLERTQNILYVLNNFIEEGKLEKIPVFVDSPLATRVTGVYRRHTNLFKSDIRREIREGDDIFEFPKLSFTVSRAESQAIFREHGPKIILAGSGMSEGGRVRSHEKELLPDQKNMILLVGFQPQGTLGRKIEDGAKVVRIDHEDIPIRAEVVSIRGFSSHKDSDHIVECVSHTAETLKAAFVCMGEPKAAFFLAQRLHDELGVKAIVPHAGEKREISF